MCHFITTYRSSFDWYDIWYNNHLFSNAQKKNYDFSKSVWSSDRINVTSDFSLVIQIRWKFYID